MPVDRTTLVAGAVSLLLAAQPQAVTAQFFNTTTDNNLVGRTFRSSPADVTSLRYDIDTIGQANKTTPYYFIDPEQNIAQPGPLIMRPNGDLVYSGYLEGWTGSMSFGPQRYKGETLLTVFSPQGPQGLGHANGTYSFLDKHYQVVFNVTGNYSGYSTDVHECIVTPQNTVLTTVYESIPYNLSAYGGPENGWLSNSLVQEVDPATGKHLFTWDPLKWLNLNDSLAPFLPRLNGTSPEAPWDAVHVNSAQKLSNGNLLISSRHYSTLYYVSGKTGEIIWQLGGKNSSFKMPENGEFHFQHDARFPEDNDKTLTVYNNGASNFAKPQNVSAGLWFDLDTDTMTASLRQRYQVWNNALTQAGGNVQPLDNDDGSVFIGQGAINAFGQYKSDGTPVYGITYGPAEGSSMYRAFYGDWHGYPLTNPSLVTFKENATAYVSWNGATDVSKWVLSGSSDNKTWTTVSSGASTSFETELSLGAANLTYYKATAYDYGDKQLGDSNGGGSGSKKSKSKRRVVSIVV